jgi:TRAP-type C4-dicarboxylate transport system permease small subunit
VVRASARATRGRETMSEPVVRRRAPSDPPGRVLYALSQLFALGGGLVLVALTLMSLASIVGRAAFARPLPGDYELVQLGCAAAVSAFLPFCQMRGGHVLVDFFTAKSSATVRATLDTLGALSIGIVAAVLAWRLVAGAISMHEANDQTTILEIPTWYALALMVPSFALFSATGFYTAWRCWLERSPRGGGEVEKDSAP